MIVVPFWWKTAAVVLIIAIAFASFLAVRVGQHDAAQAKLVHDIAQVQREVEAARIERVGQLNRINGQQCAALRQIRAAIKLTLEETDRSIDRNKHTTRAEKRAQHRRMHAAISRFNRPPCPPNVQLPNGPIIKDVAGVD